MLVDVATAPFSVNDHKIKDTVILTKYYLFIYIFAKTAYISKIIFYSIGYFASDPFLETVKILKTFFYSRYFLLKLDFLLKMFHLIFIFYLSSLFELTTVI